jgi:hypothetical protein
MCEAAIVCIAVPFTENDWLAVAADKVMVAARVANDANISVFIGLVFGPILKKVGSCVPLEVR